MVELSPWTLITYSLGWIFLGKVNGERLHIKSAWHFLIFHLLGVIVAMFLATLVAYLIVSIFGGRTIFESTFSLKSHYFFLLPFLSSMAIVIFLKRRLNQYQREISNFKNDTALPLNALPNIDQEKENEFYYQINEELSTNKLDLPVWMRLFSEYDGDANRTKAAYIRLRMDHFRQNSAPSHEVSNETVKHPSVDDTDLNVEQEVKPTLSSTEEGGSGWLAAGAIFLVIAGLLWSARDNVPDKGELQSPDHSTLAETPLLKQLMKSADSGDPGAAYKLGSMLYVGEGVKENKESALSYFMQAANAGHTESKNEVGIGYAAGIGIQKNVQEAEKWFRQAVYEGNTNANLNLVDILPSESEERNILLTACAEEGEMRCIHRLATSEFVAERYNQKPGKMPWTIRGAQLNDASLQLSLAQILLRRQTSKEHRDAIAWLKKIINGTAKPQSKAEAHLELGKLYFIGRGVLRNQDKANVHFSKAAELFGINSLPESELPASVAEMFAYGFGVPSDLEKSKRIEEASSQAILDAGFGFDESKLSFHRELVLNQ